MNDRELAVVVGASGAFGQVIVDRLVAAGLDVLAVARDAAKLAGLVDQHRGRVEACATDISADAAIQDLGRALSRRGQLVRAVVHGPGVVVAGGILDASTEAIITSVDIKVGGLLRVVRAADPHLASGARLVAIAGHYGLEPSPYAAAAGVANAALISAVRQLSLAYGPRGITAHTIAPGPADTPRLRRVAEDRAARAGTTAEAVLDEMRAESSVGAMTTPAQVAWAVTVLLAPEATSMTGSTLMLDAGRRRGLP